LTIPYNNHSNLPIAYGWQSSTTDSQQLQAFLALVIAAKNKKLSANQKLRLQYHYCFGHQSFTNVREILCSLPSGTKLFQAVANTGPL